MKLEQQVVSLELAKKLKELGFRDESAFAWCPDRKKIVTGCFDAPTPKDYNEYSNRIAAYTVAELGKMLPLNINAKSTKDGRRIIAYYLHYDCGGLVLSYEHHLNTKQVLCRSDGINEANARAKMLIYLKENNLLK